MDRVFMIAAMSLDRVIGLKQGNHFVLPWGEAYPQDRQHFREVTFAQTVIMGRNTFESIGRALPKRTNIVITNKPIKAEGIEIASSLAEAINMANHLNQYGGIWICGGARVYRDGLSVARELELTIIPESYCDRDSESKIYFPELGRGWERQSTTTCSYDPRLRCLRYVRN